MSAKPARALPTPHDWATSCNCLVNVRVCQTINPASCVLQEVPHETTCRVNRALVSSF